MLGIIFSIPFFIVGCKAFTPTGIPLTKTKNLTGAGSYVLGVICLLLGTVLLGTGVLAAFNLAARFS